MESDGTEYSGAENMELCTRKLAFGFGEFRYVYACVLVMMQMCPL